MSRQCCVERTTVLACAIALVGLITMALGIWGLCILVLERMRVRCSFALQLQSTHPGLEILRCCDWNDIGWAWPDRPCAGPAPSSGDFNHRSGSGRALTHQEAICWVLLRQ
jgi:hypothetical protein